MRDPYAEYKAGLISWDKAYAIANNNAAKLSNLPNTEEEVDYWCEQMESLAVEAACSMMTLLGYKEDEDGAYYKPGDEMDTLDDKDGNDY